MAPWLRIVPAQEPKSYRMRLIIVKRGALSTFHFLERSCKDILGVRVIWDRRREAERTQVGKPVMQGFHGPERRKEAPHSWTAADHVLVSGEERERMPSEVGQEQVANQ